MKGQPTHCVLRKVLWGIMLGLSVILLIVGFMSLPVLARGDGNAWIAMTLALGSPLFIVSCCSIPWAFEPEFDKMKKERELYKKQQGRELEEEYYAVDADIHHRSIKKRTRSFNQGLAVENCPKCGDKVDANENFCSRCGAEIYKKCSKCKTVNQAGDEFCRNCGKKLVD